MATSRGHARSVRLGCRCYAFLDAAAVALLALAIGAFVLQLARRPAGPGRVVRDEIAAVDLAQCAVIA